jgi:PKD repeat protein
MEVFQLALIGMDSLNINSQLLEYILYNSVILSVIVRNLLQSKLKLRTFPQPKGFIAEIPTYCFPPVRVNFRDTTPGAVKSEWNFERFSYPLPTQATGSTASYTFTQSHNWVVTLFVTDANGCRNSVEQTVTILQPVVRIETTDNNKLVGCTNLTKKFKIITDEQLTSFTWDFGNGATSTEPEPSTPFQ